MRRTTAIAAATAGAICLAVLVYHRGKLADLRREAADLDARVAGLKIAAGPVLPGESPQEIRDSDRVDTGEEVPDYGLIRSVWAGNSGADDELSTALAVPKLLRLVEQCSRSQIVALAESASAEALEEEDRQEREVARLIRDVLFDIIALTEPSKAVDLWIDKGNGDLPPSLVGALAKIDPPRAAELLSTHCGDGNVRERCNIAVAQNLLRVDLEAGLATIMNSYGPGGQFPYHGIVNTSYGKATAIVSASRDPQLRGQLLEIANQDPPHPARSVILEGLFDRAVFEGGADRAGDFLQEIETLSGEEGIKLIGRPNLPASDSLRLLSNQPASELRNKALRDLAGGWANIEVNQAGRWLGEQPPSPERDQMIAGFFDQIVWFDLESAEAWVGEIENEGLREERRALVEKRKSKGENP